MATPQAIAQVQQNLPTWCETVPATAWTSDYIATVLDTNNGNVLDVVRLFWIQRVSDTQPLTDTHDGSSSRPLSQDHVSATKMLAYWDDYIEASHKTNIGKIKKRYKHRNRGYYGLDPFGYGSPYARTD